MVREKISSIRQPYWHKIRGKNLGPFIFLLINLFFIGLIGILYLLRDYPMVGADYREAIPLFLDISTFFRKNGLSIQWYTPAFGGGFPVFPDPISGQYSLITLLTLIFHPLQAIAITAIIDIGIGLGAVYYLLSNLLKLHWKAGILGAIFFSANGFIMERLAVGHYVYLIFPVMVVLIVLLMESRLSWGMAGLALALVITVMIHQAGYFSLVLFGLSLLMTIPILYIYNPALFSWRRFISVASLGGGLALVLCASKLSAVYSFMRFFPRQVEDFYAASLAAGLLGIIFQLLGAMNLIPLIKLIGGNAADLEKYMVVISRAPFGYWEFDMSMSPVVFAILSAGFYQFIRRPREQIQRYTRNKRWLAWIFLVFFTWLTIEFTLAKGLVYPSLEKLPVLSSMHVNVRFAAAFILPLAVTAAIIYNRWSSNLSNRKAWLIFMTVDILTLLPLSIYLLSKTDLAARDYNVTESQQIYNLIRSGDPMTITGIGSAMDNTDAMLYHMSNLQPYEPIFGYALQNFHPEVHAGSIWEASGGYYNMTNPSGYVFPEVNSTRPFERIPVSQINELETFASYKQPGWKLPLYQQVLDRVSGVSVLVVASILAGAAVWKLVKRAQRKGSR